MGLLGQIVSGVASLFGGSGSSALAGSINNAASQRRAYQYQLDFWKQQNEYNNPAEARKRLEDAGLNINALNGSLQAAGNSSAGLPSLPSGAPEVRGSVSLTDLAAIRVANSTVRKNDADAEKSLAEAGRAREQTETEKTVQTLNQSVEKLNGLIGANRKVEERLLKLEEEYNRRTLDTRIDLTKANLTNVQRQNQLLKEQTDLVISQCVNQMNNNSIFGIRREQAIAELAQIKMQTYMISVQAELAKHKIILTDEQAKEAIARARLAWQQSFDFESKNATAYWSNLSGSLHWSAKESKRRYKWAPAMNAVSIIDSATSSVNNVVSTMFGIRRLRYFSR